VRTAKKSKKHVKDEGGIGLGQKVVHPTYGLGVVLNYEGSGESARVQINFEKSGSKWLVLAFAKLETLG
jgi:DNA helicase-2/ATP-dependent DNA helicase PcrA